MSELFRFNIPGEAVAKTVVVEKGRPVFVLGRNGTGKSALVHSFVGQVPNRVGLGFKYIPGSRPSYFDQDSLNMTPSGRLQFEQHSRSWDMSPDMRVRPINGAIRNERAIFDLQSAEIQFKVEAADQIAADLKTSEVITRLRSNSSPLNRVNRLLKQSNLPVQAVIEGAELRALRDGSIYSIAKMSDGERIALITIADVISAKENSIILIDEPELHLHPAIVVPLIAALAAERPDCAIIISTHELGLPAAVSKCRIVLVRGCAWERDVIRSWDVDLIESIDDVPDEVRVDLLGSRRKILFVEGKVGSSLDQPIYALLFPEVSVRSRASCTDVRRAVEGLRLAESAHHAKAYGLVDNDGMDATYQAQLADIGVFALPVYSVEALYYAPEILQAVAERQAETFGIDAGPLLTEAISGALATLTESSILHLAARVAERLMRDELLKRFPDRETMLAGHDATLTISVTSPLPRVLSRLKELLAHRDFHGIVRGYPIRESGALGALVKGLRFKELAHYEQAVLAAINGSEALKSLLRRRLGHLSEALGGQPR